MTPIDPASIDRWRTQIGTTESRRQVLESESLRRYALAVGADSIDPLPPLAHWAFFLPGPSDAEIGPDGHPRRGGFLPEITLPRRMFAGSTMRFAAPLEPGAEAELVSTIADVAHKRGRSGELVFVEVERKLSQDGFARVIERQQYVYREEGAPASLPRPAPAAPDGEAWQPDEVNLFRFSAATFNGHRIHYDLPYATQVEGYPALVVHGPFTAAKLAALAMREGELLEFCFRAMAPLFLGQPIYLRAAGERFEAVRCDGAIAMTAQAKFR